MNSYQNDFNKHDLKTAVILCGGKGTRLGLLGKKLPKSLVQVQKKTILWFILKSLKKNKFNHFILPVGYKGDKIRKYVKSNKIFRKYNIDIVETGIKTSIAKRIYKIKNHIGSRNFLLLNGDAIFDANLSLEFNKHVKNKFDITFICSEAEADFGIVETLNGKIVNFQRNLDFRSVKTENKNFLGHVYSGMALINKKILNENFKDKKNFEKDFYPTVIKKYRSNIYNLKGFWYAMDNIKDIDSLNRKANNKKSYFMIKKLLKKLND